GVGKSTLIKRLLEQPRRRLSVSATTRPPRPGEVDGYHYRFVDPQTFRALIDRGGFLEWAEVYGNLYGTPADEVDPWVDKGWTVLLDVDVQGFRAVRAKRPTVPAVFITPPSFEELERRIRERFTETEDRIARRLAAARQEIDAARDYDRVIVNDRVERAAAELEALLCKWIPAK
ncbi:MAG TPA: guanylate kinase, partial [Planctomycetota bacterium]|nr:guanylate kinase [Planctomycetota bacterium]